VPIPPTEPITGGVVVSATRSDVVVGAPAEPVPAALITWSVTTAAATALPVQPFRWQWRVLEPAVEPAAQALAAEGTDVEDETVVEIACYVENATK
jgi:hypothetical protein